MASTIKSVIVSVCVTSEAWVGAGTQWHCDTPVTDMSFTSISRYPQWRNMDRRLNMRFTVLGGSNEKYIFFSELFFLTIVNASKWHTGITCSIGQKNVTHVWKIHEKTLKIGVFPNFEGVKDENVFFSELNWILEGPPFHWYH